MDRELVSGHVFVPSTCAFLSVKSQALRRKEPNKARSRPAEDAETDGHGDSPRDVTHRCPSGWGWPLSVPFFQHEELLCPT